MPNKGKEGRAEERRDEMTQIMKPSLYVSVCGHSYCPRTNLKFNIILAALVLTDSLSIDTFS